MYASRALRVEKERACFKKPLSLTIRFESGNDIDKKVGVISYL